ncbi:MAG: chloride channel protein [Clostridia bacterium]|nr:chloride channel protein [Clostridia bacterium]
MSLITNDLKFSFSYLRFFVKWLVLATLVGVVGGFIGSAFHLAIDYVTALRGAHDWIIYLLPLGGLGIVGLYKLTKKLQKMIGALDTNRVLESVRGETHVPFVMAPLIFLSTVLTHLLGGSAGREGAALQLGGSIGYRMGRLFRLDEDDLHIIVMTGMSTVFAALFGTPLTAAFFALEVISVGKMHYVSIVPCLVSALVASRIALFCGLHPVRFDWVTMQEISVVTVLRVIVLAILCALVSILFCVVIKKCEQLMKKYLKNAYLRALVGGVVIVLLTLVLGTRDYNGAGMDVIERALGGEAHPAAFLLKLLFTAITISAGFKGGEIVPAFFVGSTFGCVFGGLLGLDPGFAAAIGFVATFCGVVNCPVASTLLAVEVFGADVILLFALACGISYMMSGNFGLYHSQIILYSKLQPRRIDEYAR